MKEYQVYLAGQMSHCTHDEMSEWRKEATNLLYDCGLVTGAKVNIINPVNYYNFKEALHHNEQEVMKFDLGKVIKSDIVFVNLKGINNSIGTAIEIYEATKRGIPVVAFGDYENVHPWLKECIMRYDDTMEEAAFYVKDYLFS